MNQYKETITAATNPEKAFELSEAQIKYCKETVLTTKQTMLLLEVLGTAPFISSHKHVLEHAEINWTLWDFLNHRNEAELGSLELIIKKLIGFRFFKESKTPQFMIKYRNTFGGVITVRFRSKYISVKKNDSLGFATQSHDTTKDEEFYDIDTCRLYRSVIMGRTTEYTYHEVFGQTFDWLHTAKITTPVGFTEYNQASFLPVGWSKDYARFRALDDSKALFETRNNKIVCQRNQYGINLTTVHDDEGKIEKCISGTYENEYVYDTENVLHATIAKDLVGENEPKLFEHKPVWKDGKLVSFDLTLAGGSGNQKQTISLPHAD